MRTFDVDQIPKIERPWLEPRYLVHLIMPGETLYFSDRNFQYNGHRYEDYLVDIPETVHSIESSGGYQNINAQFVFKNKPFRQYGSLIEFFIANPLLFTESEIFVLYLNSPNEVFGSDVSAKLHRVAIGELKEIKRTSFKAELWSILHSLDNRNIFTQINRANWPDAHPDAIGKYENIIYGGLLRDVPCHCVKAGATSNLFLDITPTATTIVLSEVDYPMPFPSSGTIQIDQEKITYTGKDSVNKQLIGCTRGASSTSAAAHVRGAPVWLVLSEYKYLVAGHPCKSAANPKSSGIRIPPGEYSINLNEGGKTVITFTAKQVLKIQGMHWHEGSSAVTRYGWNASNEFYPNQAAWTVEGIPQNLRDQDLGTYQRIKPNLPYGNKWVRFTVTFLPVYGVIAGIKLYIKYSNWPKDSYGYNTTTLTAYYDGGSEVVGPLDFSGSFIIQNFPLVTKNPITRVELYVVNGSGVYPTDTYLAEIWLEYTLSSVGGSAADGVWGNPEEVIAPPITCDAEGYKDDGSGTYTGAPNALIENPSDVRRHFLTAVCGRSLSEIGTSFAAVRSEYAARISGGYKFGMILSEIGKKPSEIVKRLDEQSRSNTSEQAGKFELQFNGAVTSGVLRLSESDFKEEPAFDQQTVFDIRDKVRAVYDIDWAESSIFTGYKFGRYKKQTERGSGTRVLDIEFPAIQSQAMAEDVADWILMQHETPWPTVEVTCNRAARVLERGDLIELSYLFWGYLIWKVLGIREIPHRQVYVVTAKGIGYVGSLMTESGDHLLQEDGGTLLI